MKLTNEEFHLLTQYWVSRRVFFRDETLNQPVDKLIEIAKEHINDKLEMAKKSLSFADKIKDMDINNISYEDILSFVGKRWVLRKGKKGEDKVVRVLKDVSEEIQGYAEDKYLDSLHKYKALLEKIVNQTEDIKGGK